MRYIIFSLVLFSWFSLIPSALAASLKISSELESFRVGDVVSVLVLIDTESQTLNAVEAEIIFPSDILEFVTVNDAGSVISLWVKKPTFDGVDSVSLSGITPGGFSSQTTELLELKFRAVKAGQGMVVSDQVKLLIHDGLGTEALVEKQNLPINVNSDEASVVANDIDEERPENFKPEIIEDPDVFNGKHTLIFSTKDKNSGINRYEVKEGWFGRYHLAESPYELENQSLDKEIQVKAIDNAGNERLETIYPQNWQPWSKRPAVIFSILIACVLSLLIWRRILKIQSTK